MTSLLEPTTRQPAGAGVGLRARHFAEVMAARTPAAWFEVHAENYMGGGPRIRALEAVRRDYAISLHGVGLSLGSAGGLDLRHLERQRALIERIEPALVSEHLAWCVSGGVYLNDLLPLPYTEETLRIVCDHVEQTQEAFKRRILIENPSTYLRFAHSTIPEAEFIAEIARRTGCGLLCDVNNIFVSAHNTGLDPERYIDTLPPEAIGEIHLAGHARNEADGEIVLIDDHGSRVDPQVWALYARACARFGDVPALIEWDTAVPELSVLLAEARIADRIAAAEGARHGLAA
jgi:uncharacterized protein